MKNLVLFIISGLIHFHGFSQTDYNRIQVSPDIQLIKISDNAYIHVSYSSLPKFGRFPSNGLIFINQSEAFLFDTPTNDSLTRELVSWITDSMKLKIVGFVPNHWHEDCMGGLNYLQKQHIPSYANQLTIDIAKLNKLPLPNQGFYDSLQLRLGDKLIKCYYFGAAHSMDNIVVWLPSEQILFAGCMVKSIDSENLGNTVDGDLLAYPKTIEKVLQKFSNAKIVIPGHGQFGGMELVTHTMKLSSKY